MAVQIFLQGKILGGEQFLLSRSDNQSFEARAHWLALVSEVLPRALLAELGLSKMLLGSSGAEQFLLVLPGEVRDQAEEFLSRAASNVESLTAGIVKLVWAVTENLGDWTVVRKRLNEALQQRLGTPVNGNTSVFEPKAAANEGDAHTDLITGDVSHLRDTGVVGWSPEQPGAVQIGGGKHTWPLGSGADAIPYARHIGLDDEGNRPATLDELAARSAGRPVWGVLRGDVDNFGARIRRALSIEEHVQLSVMFKQFFAGELEVVCSLPASWRKVTILYAGGDDFAAYGSWDALIGLARELQRLFRRFADEHLKDYTGVEAKTLSMALALALEEGATLERIYEEAGRNLEIAKSSGKDSFWLLGRTLEWREVSEAAEGKDALARLLNEFGASPLLLDELTGFYKDVGQTGGRRLRNARIERPWRFHRRLSIVLGNSRNKEFQRIRTELISNFTGRNAANARLRPAGRVALDWARLETQAGSESTTQR